MPCNMLLLAEMFITVDAYACVFRIEDAVAHGDVSGHKNASTSNQGSN